MNKSPLFWIIYALQFAVVATAYAAASYFAQELYPVSDYVATFAPQSGVALAAIFIFGFRFVPAIALGSLVVALTYGAPILAGLGLALGNSLEPLLGVYLLQSLGFNRFFVRLQDGIIFILVAIATSFVSSVIDPVVLGIAGTLPQNILPITSLLWWSGNLVGTLTIGPALIKWFARPFTFSLRSFTEWIEVFLFLIGVIVTSILIFWDPIPELTIATRAYLMFIPLTWGALRIGPRFMTAAIAIAAVIASTATFAGFGPFAGTSIISEVIALDMFLATISIIFLLFVTTVDERKISSERLQRSVEMLREDVEEMSSADQAKNEFIAALSHELRTPLAPILSMVELMKLRKMRDPDVRSMIDATHANVLHMAHLLDDLLDIARISRRKIELHPEDIELKVLVDRSIQVADAIIREHRHILEISITNMLLHVDPLRIQQVIVNLLTNAAKYTNDGGTIAVRSWHALGPRGDAGVTISIKDTGVGIPAHELNRIFEPFRQLDYRLKKSARGGLGIGLSLAKRFVELHGGTIEAKSDGLGAGSEFSVWLPAQDVAPQPKSEAKASLETPRSHHAFSILIVDDHIDGAEALAQLLRHSGHEVKTASTVREAQEILASFVPQVAFLDISLKNENGYELAQMIRANIDSPPYLIALTGHGREEDKRTALENGFNYHLTKPISIAELQRVLASIRS